MILFGAQGIQGVRRYLIEELIGSGGMGVVYRAFDRLTGRKVAFKHVRSPESSMLFTTVGESVDYRRALAQEFKTLASLRHPNIISVFDYGFDGNLQPYFTMELLEDPQDILQAGLGRPFQQQLDLMVQTLQALMYLHRRDIIHRDLKPDNVLVVGGQVKLLDFGLAVQREIIERQQRESISGTLPYLAPELLLGQPASKQSDLYAIGMIAYELFSGKYPFSISSVDDLVGSIIHTMPDVAALNLDPRVADVLSRLLSKSPEDRFSNAEEILSIYVEATGRALGTETNLTRESFLQAAKFVGREAEFRRLVETLHGVIGGKGSAWLVGGESGVGKSRLLDELRTQGLIDGALVLRGQAVVQGGVPYTLWRDALRTLCLQIDLSDREAGVLKSLVPDIGMLIGREVSDAPELDPQTTQIRLLNTIEDVFSRQTRPLLVVLEDLQWADNESVELLRRLSQHVQRYPLMLVASFRDDERSDLPSELPGVPVLRLLRLEADKIAELSASMLGEAIGRQAEVTELLERETEGNIFFIVEVVRVLAEEAGQLDQIGKQTLPQRVFAGGVKTIIQRRLNRIPEADRPLLAVAAVAGRHLDLALLAEIAPQVNQTQWLSVCANAAVLEVQDERWRFAHDKLRESVVEQLDKDQHRNLHRQVAEAMERLYPGDVIHAGGLAYHWREAANEAKEAFYLVQAGEHALTTGAYKDAQQHLKRAVMLYERLKVSPVQHAHVHWLIGRTLLTVGQLEQAKPHLEQAVAFAGYPVPSSPGAIAGSLLKEVGQQIINRIRTGLLGRPLPPAHNLDSLKIVLRASESLAEVYYYSAQRAPTLHVVIRGLNLAERGGAIAKAELARSYSSMAGVMAIIPLKKMVRLYTRLADETLKYVDDPDAISWVMLSEGTHDNERGDLESAERRLRYGMQLAEQMGHSRRWQENATQAAKAMRLRGNVLEALELNKQVYASALEQNNLQALEWALLGQSQCHLLLHDYQTAMDCLRQAEPIHAQTQSKSNLIEACGVRTLLALLTEHQDEALRYSERGRELIGHAVPASYRVVLGYAGAVAYALSTWEDQPHETELLKWGMKGLKQGAQRFDLALPRYYAYLSWQARLEGDREKAQQMGEKSLAEAQRMSMPYEQALALYMLAQLGNSKYLNRANQLLNVLGGTFDLSKESLL
jgi:eukaryotic-like serine/threonine-protein kinase